MVLQISFSRRGTTTDTAVAGSRKNSRAPLTFFLLQLFLGATVAKGFAITTTPTMIIPNRQLAFAAAVTRPWDSSSSTSRNLIRSHAVDNSSSRKSSTIVVLWGSLPRKSSDSWQDHVEEEVLGGDESSFLEDYYNDNNNDNDEDDAEDLDIDGNDNGVGGDGMLEMKRDDSFLYEFARKAIGEGNGEEGKEDENNDEEAQGFKFLGGGGPVSLLVTNNYEFEEKNDDDDNVDEDNDVIWEEGLEAMGGDPASLAVPNEEWVLPDGDNHFLSKGRSSDTTMQDESYNDSAMDDEGEENNDDGTDVNNNNNTNELTYYDIVLSQLDIIVEASEDLVAYEKAESGEPSPHSLRVLQYVKAGRDVWTNGRDVWTNGATSEDEKAGSSNEEDDGS